jgi:hypothetical protein
VPEPDPPASPQSGELEPRQRVDGDDVRSRDRTDVAEQRVGTAGFHQGAGSLAERRDIGALDRAGEPELDRGQLTSRSRGGRGAWWRGGILG